MRATKRTWAGGQAEAPACKEGGKPSKYTGGNFGARPMHTFLGVSTVRPTETSWTVFWTDLGLTRSFRRETEQDKDRQCLWGGEKGTCFWEPDSVMFLHRSEGQSMSACAHLGNGHPHKAPRKQEGEGGPGMAGF